jgi:DNA-directed RNA polymerase subunit E'/Rpb7
MFFIKMLQREMLLEPRYLGSKMKTFVKERLFNELEGQCLGKVCGVRHVSARHW